MDRSYVYSTFRLLPYDCKREVVEQIFIICRDALSETTRGGTRIDLDKIDDKAMKSIADSIKLKR